MTTRSLMLLVHELEALKVDWSHSLTRKQRQVIDLTLGLSKHKPHTLRQISEIMNISSQRIWQLRSRAEEQLIFIREMHLQEVRDFRFCFYFRLIVWETLLQWLQHETVEVHNELSVNDVIDTPIEVLNLSTRSYNCLDRCQIRLVREILESQEDLMWIRNLGVKSMLEIQEAVNTLIFEKTGVKGFW